MSYGQGEQERTPTHRENLEISVKLDQFCSATATSVHLESGACARVMPSGIRVFTS